MATVLVPSSRETDTPPAAPPRRRRAFREFRPGTLTYLSLTAVVFFSAFPLYWIVVVASLDNSAIGRVPPPLVPGAQLVENIQRLFDTVDVRQGADEHVHRVRLGRP